MLGPVRHIRGLWTAAQQESPVRYVAPANRQYCILRSFAELEQTPGVPGLDIPGLYYAPLARGYGATGVRAAVDGARSWPSAQPSAMRSID